MEKYSPSGSPAASDHPLEGPSVTAEEAANVIFGSRRFQNLAACTKAETSLFFLGSGNPTKQVEQAKAICNSCPVREPCREYSIKAKHNGRPLQGIWGGDDRARTKANKESST